MSRASGRLSRKEILSYAGGEIASNLAWTMVLGFLLVYYTDVALMPAAALGTLMLVTRILDAVFDPAVGILVDRTSTRWGKARPYLMFATIPFCLLLLVTFTIPDMAVGNKLVYAYITFGVLGLAYSLLYIPYGAMMPMLTSDAREKTLIGSYRAMATSIASVMAYGLTMPIVNAFGPSHKQLGFTAAAGFMGLVTLILYVIVVVNCRERIRPATTAAHIPVALSLKQMVANPIWRLIFFMAQLIFLRIGVMVSSAAYFTKEVLGDPGLVSVMLPLLSFAILGGGFLSRFYLPRVGKKRGSIMALLASIVLILIMPFLEGYHTLFVACFVLSNVSNGVLAAAMFVIGADAAEVHEAMFGHRSEGLLTSSTSFGSKIGMAFGVAMTAYGLAFAGYDPLHVSASAATTLRWVFYGGQIALFALQILCLALSNVPERGIGEQAPGEPQ